ncbi:hypothetical protein GCM10018790_69650 [Kitasatospora xanthocidica]|nr:hypothetical protein GCM10018790_69650 [Kitasatospora xanthocidica]
MRVREIDDDGGSRLLRIVRRGTGSVVTWRRAQMVLGGRPRPFTLPERREIKTHPRRHRPRQPQRCLMRHWHLMFEKATRLITPGDDRHQATTPWVEEVENTDTHQDVVLIAGDPADPTSRRLRLVDAWASASYHLDEDEDPDAFAISFADIAVEK